MVLSRSTRQLSVFYLAGGLLLAALLFVRGMALAAAVQGFASAMGSMALLAFGGGPNES